MSTPAIFYTPHQDDESLGMAGAIVEHLEAGRPVYVVLLTDGHPSAGHMQPLLSGGKRCSWHGRRHDFGLTVDEMIQSRNRELFAACDALGVHRVFLAEGGGIPDLSLEALTARIRSVIQDFESRYPGSSHKLVSGVKEARVVPSNTAHVASWNAAMSLKGEISDFRFYRVYELAEPDPTLRTAERIDTLSSSQREKKRKALEEYKCFDPGRRRYAFGYHSVRSYIDRAMDEPHEFVDFLD